MIAVRRVLRAGAGTAERRVRRLLETERERRVAAWIGAGHDRTLRLDYDLQPTSLVLDVGGFAGQWASDVYARYCCRIHVFEPVREYAAAIERRFARNPDIRVHAFGLAGTTRDETIDVQGVGSSLFARSGRDAERRETVRLVAAAEFLRDTGMEEVHLAKINIEGGEYELLEHLLDEGLAARFRDLQVQFHDFVPRAAERMRGIQERLASTHHLTYQAEFVWENWRRTAAAPRV
jgi:FkbM family methyltransferase